VKRLMNLKFYQGLDSDITYYEDSMQYCIFKTMKNRIELRSNHLIILMTILVLTYSCISRDSGFAEGMSFDEPLSDTRFRTWPAGDTFFVYPGAKTSIRFEKLREGIQDFEKIRIIENGLKKLGTPEADRKLEEIHEHLAGFTIESIAEGKALKTVIKAREVINSMY